MSPIAAWFICPTNGGQLMKQYIDSMYNSRQRPMFYLIRQHAEQLDWVNEERDRQSLERESVWMESAVRVVNSPREHLTPIMTHSETPLVREIAALTVALHQHIQWSACLKVLMNYPRWKIHLEGENITIEDEVVPYNEQWVMNGA